MSDMHQAVTTLSPAHEKIISDLIVKGYAFVECGQSLPEVVRHNQVQDGTMNEPGFNEQWAKGYLRRPSSTYTDVIYRPGDQRLWGKCLGNHVVKPMTAANGWNMETK